MTDKLTIKAEQVTSRKGGYVNYIDEGSTLRKVKVSDVIILEEGKAVDQVAKEVTPVVEPPPSTEPAPPAEAEAPAPAQTESKPKPSKRGQKPKEDVDMATKTAAKKAPKKAPAKAAKPRVKREGGSVRTIGGKPVDISRYEKARAPGGGTSYNNGDAVAEKLQGKDLDAVYDIVARALKVEVKELKKKYGSLNPGMQRMNLGNRLRKVSLPKEAK